MRCFIAIELDNPIKKKLSQLQDRLRYKDDFNDRSIRWVNPQQIHLTLKFLGDIEDDLAFNVSKVVTEVCDECEPFDFEIAGVGCFPEQGPARVLWAGVKQGCENLAQLQGKIDLAMQQLGFPLEKRRFSGHLTLARIKLPKAGSRLQSAVAELGEINIGCQCVDSVTVFQSELAKNGPIHAPMSHGQLRDKLPG
jgi:2'-5' RNA ligase